MKKPGDKIVVHSYKHDGSIHRIWTTANLVEQDDKKTIIANKRTKVIEHNGRFWFTREPSVTWFFKDRWFNVIGILREQGIYYYCNIASPFLIDDEALKYIDYDLDIKVQPDGNYRILDRKEYNVHKQKLAYPNDLRDILEKELHILRTWIEKEEGPFQRDVIKAYYQKYQNLKGE